MIRHKLDPWKLTLGESNTNHVLQREHTEREPTKDKATPPQWNMIVIFQISYKLRIQPALGVFYRGLNKSFYFLGLGQQNNISFLWEDKGEISKVLIRASFKHEVDENQKRSSLRTCVFIAHCNNSCHAETCSAMDVNLGQQKEMFCFFQPPESQPLVWVFNTQNDVLSSSFSTALMVYLIPLDITVIHPSG